MTRGSPKEPRTNRKPRADLTPGLASSAHIRTLLAKHPEGLQKDAISKALHLSYEGHQRLSARLNGMQDIEALPVAGSKTRKKYRLLPPPTPPAAPAPVAAPAPSQKPPEQPVDPFAGPALPGAAAAPGALQAALSVVYQHALATIAAGVTQEITDLRKELKDVRHQLATFAADMARTLQALAASPDNAARVAGTPPSPTDRPAAPKDATLAKEELTLPPEPPPPEVKPHQRKLPRITIVGLMGDQENMIRQEYSSVYDLYFVGQDETGSAGVSRLKSLSATSKAVFLFVDKIGHARGNVVAKAGGNLINVTGGMTSLRRALDDFDEEKLH